jgi:dTDP-4-dehydrorhamnose reductase
MSLKILLTGKNGQIGRDLQVLLSKLGTVTALDREQLDLATPDSIRAAIRDLRPNLIVNAAAYTAVDRAESEPELAQAVNGDALEVMAQEAREIGAVIVHYSTDYVFDGTKQTPYVETDATNPINVYGKTKLAGEQALQSSGVPYIIFRTSWVYATRGRNFLLTILKLASEQEELRIVDDQIGAPTWSRTVADATCRVLGRIVDSKSTRSSLEKRSGIYHLTAAGEATWFGFARVILEECASAPKLERWYMEATQGRPLKTKRVIPIPSAEFRVPARRPANSLLSNSKVNSVFGVELPDWRTDLRLAILEDPLGDNLIAVSKMEIRPPDS